MTLPPPLQAYFDAERAGGAAALGDAFAPDAVVVDEGRCHAGRAAIDVWWRGAKAKYRHVAEPLEVREEGDLARVAAKVSGNFPGSPVELTFAFRIEGDQIAGLEIGA
jgi:ketosteroid isomerase-like protein